MSGFFERQIGVCTDLRSLGLDFARTGKGSVDFTHDERSVL